MSEEEIATETEQELQESPPESPPEPPIAKKRAPRKKKEAVAEIAAAAPLKVDADFWGELLATSRAQDRAARVTRFSNLVQFK
jgi:hypothetical protein